jgi:hypothetical protein
MLPRHAYLNADGIVVQVIDGAVDGFAHDALLRDYGVLFGAVRCVRVESDVAIWIGGTYDSTVGFAPPPEQIIEQPTEGTTDGIPVLE